MRFLRLFLIPTILLGADPGEEYARMPKSSTLEFIQFDANRMKAWAGNNGQFISHIPTGNGGLEWPAGSGNRAMFASGFWLIGMVDSTLRSASAEFSTEFNPGVVDYDPQTMLQGTPRDPHDPLNQIYWIKPGDCAEPDQDCYNWEYANWPASDGAPAHDGEHFIDENGNGIRNLGEPFEDHNGNNQYDPPDGEMVTGEDPPVKIDTDLAWWAINDLDPDVHRNLWNTDPLGVEVQVSLYTMNPGTLLDNVLFYEMLVVNKSGNLIEDLYLGNWNDADVGDANDDMTGCDTSLHMGFTYGGMPNDQDYGYQNPTMAYAFMQGAQISSPGDSLISNGKVYQDLTAMGMTAHSAIWKSSQNWSDPETPGEAYLKLQGLGEDGVGRIDPDGNPSVFHYWGDPYLRTGWLHENEMSPRDHRNVIATGPVNLAPWNDSDGDGLAEIGEPGVQQIVLAFATAQGLDHRHSVEVARHVIRHARSAWLRRGLENDIPAPEIDVSAFDQEIILDWELTEAAPVGYEYEGLRLYQTASPGGEWYLLETHDVVNAVRVIALPEWDQDTGVLQVSTEYQGTDAGIPELFYLDQDYLHNRSLTNNREYYFGLSAYYYSDSHSPSVLESEVSSVSVRPHGDVIGTEQVYSSTDTIGYSHEGNSGADVRIDVLNPGQLTGDLYRLSIEKDTLEETIEWYLGIEENGILVDTLHQHESDPYERDFLDSTELIDGFRAHIGNLAIDPPLFNESWEQTVNEDDGQVTIDTYPAISPGAVDHLILMDGDTVLFDSIVFRGGYRNENGDRYSTGYYNGIPEPECEGYRPDWNCYYRKTYEIWEDATGSYVDLYRVEYHVVVIQSFASDVGGSNHTLASIPGIGGGFSDTDILLNQLEIRFTEQGQQASRWRIQNGFVPEMAQVPFELWDVEREVQLCLGFVDWDSTGRMHDPTTQSLEGDWIVAIYRDYNSYGDSLHTMFNSPYTGWLWIFRVGSSNYYSNVSSGSQYSPGDVVQLSFTHPIGDEGDHYRFIAQQPGDLTDKDVLEAQLDRINVFPNPYFGVHDEEQNNRFVTISGLPRAGGIVRIFTLAGDLVRKIEHAETQAADTPFEYWDLRNELGEPVASGMYILHVDIPNIGHRVLKLAVMQRGY